MSARFWPRGAERATQKQMQDQLREQLAIVEQQQALLHRRNLQFETALNNISQGLCFFDGEQRLLIYNQRYVEMYDLDPASVHPGMTLRAIIDLRCRAGSCPKMSPEAYQDWRNQIVLTNLPTDSVVELMNGRVFEIHHRPMPGGGWVATHDDITIQREAEAKIAHMAHHDALTGLANRVLLTQRLEQALAAGECAARGITLHLLDLDHFKKVNDTLGHPMGDVLLMEVAERLRSVAGENDLIARMGGDEFAIVQVGVLRPDDVVTLASRAIEAICRPYNLHGRPATVGVSIGIALATPGLTRHQWICNADLALYDAKRSGRRTCRVFEEAARQRVAAAQGG